MTITAKMDRGDYASMFLRIKHGFEITIETPLRVSAAVDPTYASKLRDALKQGLARIEQGSSESEILLDLPVTITTDIETARRLLRDLNDRL